MSAPKRFWKLVEVLEVDGGFAIALDTRTIKTPAKNTFYAPTRALAEAVADEWRAQGERMDPASMALTRYVNSVLDGVATQRELIVEAVAGYAETDLLCYRADGPDRLVSRQSEAWDPLLAWIIERYDAPLILATGVMPVEQPRPSIERLGLAVKAHSDFELAGLHDLVAISGSLILGLAVSEGVRAPMQALDLSRVDENWQIEQWGADEEAEIVASRKADDFAAAARLMELVREHG